ncbi:MAG TPA: transposase [Acidobacteriota bacterium]|nr:transposase [Acidobacteriota bacterium]
MAQTRDDWVLGYVDEVWWSRFAQPAMHAWTSTGEALRLVSRTRKKEDEEPKALSCYGVLFDEADGAEMLLRFVKGRPVSHVTTAFLDWGVERLAARGKRVWALVWDNASWHISQAVKGWIKAHNRKAKREGGVRIITCELPVKSPWLNPIEPKWLHGKRAICEPDGELTVAEVMERVCAHYGCELLDPIAQKTS